jgi:hypothetical protein
MLHRNKIAWGIANIVLIALIIFVFAGVTSISLMSPIRGSATDDRTPEFSWAGLQGNYLLMVDDDPAFGSPLTYEILGNSFSPAKDLEFGSYYWKVVSNGIESEVNEFSILSTVQLSRKKETVRNTGNVDVLMKTITGAFLLGEDEVIEIGEENVTAEQY